MAKLITVYWRDIPAQVIAKRGRESAKVALADRFQVAIDRAAMRAGRGSSEHYLNDWRREPRACGNDLRAEAEAEAKRLESLFDDARLARLVKAGGVDKPLEAEGA
ncbi:MAG: virulence factor [Gammaproteobacteria bacterium]|nr:virulence factor [Gammaproteobacteria bacterium]